MTGLTLKAFFCDDADGPIYGSCEAVAADRAVQAALAAAPKPVRERLARSIRTALDDVFHVPLDGLLISSWQKVAGIQEALEATRLDPAKVVFVPLLEHKVSSTHKPHIDVKLGPKSLARLVFDIALALELKSVELELRQGRIAGLRSGECAGNGVFSFEGQNLIRKATPAFALPGRLRFATADA